MQMTLLAKVPTLFVIQPDVATRNYKEFVACVKKNPGQLNHGAAGNAEFAQRAGIKLTHVPFKGNADNVQAILGGHVMAASEATGWAPQVTPRTAPGSRATAFSPRRPRSSDWAWR